MKRRIIAFYDVLLLSITCGPLMICSILIFVFGKLYDLDWILKYWYLVLLFAVGIMVPIAVVLCFLRYTLFIGNQSIYFHYSPYITTWKKLSNIDSLWNQNMFFSEIKDVEIVKLTEEEKQTKVYYKHWFNKYLKINLKYGKSKYVYVGNYSNLQIKKIIELLTSSKKNF